MPVLGHDSAVLVGIPKLRKIAEDVLVYAEGDDLIALRVLEASFFEQLVRPVEVVEGMMNNFT